MRALVVYESVFGDARAIADAVAEGLSGTVRTDVVAAAEAPEVVDPDVELLVVGGPNHAFGMPRQSTREGAVQQHGAVIPDPARGLREWLQSVRVERSGLAAAAFDTRSRSPRLLVKMDHAAKTEEKLLAALRAEVVAPAEHFSVLDVKGPLVEGEQDRARRWGRELAEVIAARSAGA